MKKKILFVLNEMSVGGIAKSLSNLLCILDNQKDCEVDLFLLRKNGVYLNKIPDSVNVLEARGILKYYGASQLETKQISKRDAFFRFFVAGWTKVFTNFLPLKLGIKQNKLKKEYDL